jgi:TolB-like protein/tetratricopeptide (TPR) repeat protein
MARGDPLYSFGPFCLDAEAGVLLRGSEPTLLGRRAVALLRALLDGAGMLVSKEALIDAGWEGLAVAENNLTVQIATLRRTLAEQGGAEDWIQTLPRRGYRYAGPAVTRGQTGQVAANPSPFLPDKGSIAVLPFDNLSDDPAQLYFTDGMVDDIVNGLSRIKSLFVTARRSSFAYRGEAMDVPRIGRELGVRYVLEGSVRKDGSRVRVTARLVDVAHGSKIWAERYDSTSDDIFALQDDVAASVVGAVAPSVRRAEIERVRRKRPLNLDAYDLVLRAQTDVDSGMPDQVARALAVLNRAIELEPTYALAHGNAAMCHHCLFLRSGLQDANRSASIHHSRLAILHGADDANALALAGFSLGMDGHDRDAAFVALEAARAISPSSALAYILGSVILGWGGQAEQAIAWSTRGLRLSPLDPWTFAAYDAQAMSHLLMGDFDEAGRAAYRSVQANPAHSITYVQLAAALAKLGRLDQARAAAARVLHLQPSFRYSRHFAGVNCDPELARVLGEGLAEAGLPE